MKKKQYILPLVEVVPYDVRNIMRVGSELPDDPGSTTPAPGRKTSVF